MNYAQQNVNGELEDDFLIVNRTDAGYRVYPASSPSKRHLVTVSANDLACTCDAFAEDGTCEHVRAVFEQVSEDERIEHEERRAIQGEGTAMPKKNHPATKTSV